MRILFGCALALPLLAQQAATPPVSPVPASESWLTGYIDIGERWRSDVGGSLATYRSVVDLGSGPKLIGTDFTIVDPKRRFFDRVRVRAHNWGDDPYENLHILAEKQSVYEFNADYRRVAYFNNLPSFADPLLSRGISLNEQSFDTRRTLGSFSLDLLPSRTISPYLAYDRDSSNGSGVSVLQANGNEFPVPATLRDSTDLYRGGFHFTGRRFHITLEEGGNTFRNDQNTYIASGATANTGNNSTPVLGQPVTLSGLLQDYGVRGTGTFTKAILTVTPFSWLDIYGHFLFSQPRNDVNYQQYNSGNFILLSQALFYTSEQYLVNAVSKLPHSSGDLGWEIRPVQHIRILQSWMTDRLHNAASANQADTLLLASASSALFGNQLQQSLATNYNQAETNVIAELRRNITLRGGYRYVWGDSRDAVLPPEGLPTIRQEKLRRHVGLGAVTWRTTRKLSVTGEFEGASSGSAYFRTSLYDYKKVRARGRYQILDTLHLSADYSILSNRNPNADASYKFLVHQESVSLNWNPAGKNYEVQGSYEHCGYHSQIAYLVPQLLAPAESIYTEYCHSISGLVRTSYRKLEVSGGGAVALTSGSRPTAYYQPTAKVSLRLNKNTGIFAEWRYYGLGETFYAYESFRAHLFTTGLRFTR